MPPRKASDFIHRVGRNVARLRKAKGLTQAGLAEVLKTEPDYIGRIERGLENLTLRSLVRLGGALGVDPSALVRRLESEKK